MADKVKYIARVLSVEKFGQPTIWKLIARVVGSKAIVTLTLPVEPRFRAGEEISVRVD